MLADRFGKLFQLVLLEGLAWVGGGIWSTAMYWNALLSCMVPSFGL